jgi:hypothetical protein
MNLNLYQIIGELYVKQLADEMEKDALRKLVAELQAKDKVQDES